jgi:hypothetical protein
VTKALASSPAPCFLPCPAAVCCPPHQVRPDGANRAQTATRTHT